MHLDRFLPSFTVALAGIALLAPALVLGHSANEPAPRTDQGWKDRQELLNKRAAEAGEKAQIIFIGDSITQGWEGEGKEVWAKYYAPRNAVNLGIGGDRTQHVLWRLENGNVKGLKPKAAVVMIGTNNSNGDDNTPGQIADGVAAIVNKLRTALPETKVLLVSIFPRGENFNNQRGKILQVNQVIRKLANNENVIWIDFGQKFVTSEGLIPRDLMPDFLHLTSKGYSIWAESIERRLSQILGDNPVQAASRTTTSGLGGEWIWTINGPEGKPVSGPLILTQSGQSVGGKFARGEDKWLLIENGKMDGNQFSWTVKRDRPTGGNMLYQMKGSLNGDEIKGQVQTEMDGNPVVSDWSAKRKI